MFNAIGEFVASVLEGIMWIYIVVPVLVVLFLVVYCCYDNPVFWIAVAGAVLLDIGKRNAKRRKIAQSGNE